MTPKTDKPEKKRISIGTILVVLIIIACVGYMVYPKLPEKYRVIPFLNAKQNTQVQAKISSMPKNTAKVNVEVLEIKDSVFEKSANINGELKAKDTSINLTSDVGGTVKKVLVSKGQTITKGTPVAVVDPSVPGSTYKERTIVSNFDGTVLNVNVYEGQTVKTDAVLASLGKPEKLILCLDIPEKYLAMVKEGTKATFSVAAYPDYQYSATVSYMEKSVKTATRTVSAELEIDNPDSKLLEGMFVKTRVITQHLENVFTVPTKALSSYLGDSTLYVVRDGKAVRTVVTTSSANDSYTVITEGLEKGDLVIVAGSVTDGAPVNVIN